MSSRTLSESVARTKLARRAGAEMRKEGQTTKATARAEHCLQTGSHLWHFSSTKVRTVYAEEVDYETKTIS